MKISRPATTTRLAAAPNFHEIEMHEMSEDFFPCLKAAGTHLNKQVDADIQSWLRAHPYPPFLEHLSVRLGNQLFFIRIDNVDGKAKGPGSLHGLLSAASSAKGRGMPHADEEERRWILGTGHAGWGLVDAVTLKSFDPVTIITDQKVEMTPWELHDIAVQVVRDYIENQGFQLMSRQGNPAVDPSIWFVGENRKARVGRRALGQVPGQQRSAAPQLGGDCRELLKIE